MNVLETGLPGVLIIEPKVFGDSRGFFFESWNARALEAAGVRASFVQDNHSRSAKNVLRGLHYQIRQPQGKLVRVVAGEVFDVVSGPAPFLARLRQVAVARPCRPRTSACCGSRPASRTDSW